MNNRVHAELQGLLDMYYGSSSSSDPRMKKMVESKLKEWKRRPDGPKIAFEILYQGKGNAYLQFFCLTILEDLVSKRWNTVEAAYASKIRELLFKFLTNVNDKVPRYVRTKAAKVYVSVGVQDWPERYAGFWNHIEHTTMQQSTRTVGTHILSIALESFGNVDKTGTTLNLLSSRRKKIKHMMKAQIPSVLKLLTILLQRSVGKNDDEMTVLTLRALLSLLSYNNIRDLPEVSLLNELFKTMQCYKNEIGVVSMRCFVEIMNNVMIPVDRLSYLLSVAKHILGLLNTFASRPELRNDAEENYVPQLLSFVSIFIKRHMSRIYCNNEFPMKQTLSLIHKFTFLQSDNASNFLACLEIWVVTATFVSETMEQRSHELNETQRQRLICFEPIFSQLMSHLWPRALMSRGGEIILTLDDEEPAPSSVSFSSSSPSSELVQFQHRITNSIAMMLFSPIVTHAFASLLVPTARASLQILGKNNNNNDNKHIQEQQRRATIDLAVVFESIAASSQRFSSSQSQIVVEILRLAISTAGTSAKQCMHSRGSAYRRLHTSALVASSALLKWCRNIRIPILDELAEGAANVALNSIVTNISMPPESVINSGVSLLRCVILELQLKHPNEWKALRMLQLNSENGNVLAQFVSRLPRFAQGQIYAMLASASTKLSTSPQWLGNIMRPILQELVRCADLDAVGSQIEIASSRIERACMICTDVIREFRDTTKDKRREGMKALRGMVNSSSKLLVAFLDAVSTRRSPETLTGRERVRAKRVETLLLRTSKHLFALHDAAFQCFGHVVDVRYVKNAVQAILRTMNDHVLRRLLFVPTNNKVRNSKGVVLLEHCIDILTRVADDRTRHFHAMVPGICKFLTGRLYPCLCNVWAGANMPVDVITSYFKCLGAMLLNRHSDFVLSKAICRAKNVKRNFTSSDNEAFWRCAFESMARYLNVTNAPPSVLQCVLNLLHELDEKHGSFECFNPAMLTAFGSLLLRMICSRSHELLSDALMDVICAVAKKNLSLFSGNTMIEFLRSMNGGNRLKPDVVLNLQTRIRNCKGSSYEFKGVLESVINDLAFLL